MIIVDTTVWIDYLDGSVNEHTAWLDKEITIRPIGLVDLSLCEILQGIQRNTVFDQVLRDLSKFHIFDTGGTSLAIAAARNYRSLRSRGYTVRKTIDCLIATFCLETGQPLLHRDRDFTPFETYLGLLVIHP